MSSEQWERTKQLLDEALRLAPERRAAYLTAVCGGDSELRAEVESLLASHEAADSQFLAAAAPDLLHLTPSNPRPQRLPVGTRLGPCEILTLVGSGGMGEVYRARDTKLGREVALKILPDSFTHDPKRLARFRREAQVLAALNHPHIGAIYGLDESNGTQFLVLELVDGESLDKRIARGPIPLDEALAIAKQIAEALEAAHEKGIIHRDLKPANIALTQDGQVKVLDFGLAKATEATSGTSIDLANSPAIESPVMMTSVGVILGTAAYMSPEQAKGRAADKRTDIWAFGCVLYEMLSGTGAFGGEDVADTLAHVLTKDPDWAALPRSMPAPIRTLLRRCLERDRRVRLDSAADARLEIDDALAIHQGNMTERVDDPDRAIRYWRTLALIAFGVLVVILTWIVGLGRPWGARSPSEVTTTAVQFSVQAPEDSLFGTNPVQPHPAVSPDGKRLAYVAISPDGTRLIWIRDLNSLAARPLAGTSGVTGTPFWSPDGRFVGFFAHGQLKKIRSAGGPPETLCEAAGGFAGTWSHRDDILFAVEGQGLSRVSASGGTPEYVTQLDRSREEFSHRYPQFLPDGRRFFYLVRSARAEHRGSFVGSLDSRARKRVLADDTAVAYEPPASPSAGPGHLLFVRETTLMAQPFDVERLEVIGDAVQVAAEVPVAPTVRKAPFSVAGGTLVYRSEDPAVSQLVWVDRTGNDLGTGAGPEVYHSHRVSPDGRQVVYSLVDRQTRKTDLWVLNLTRGIRMRLTSDPSNAENPVWSPDGSRVAFVSNRSGAWAVYTKGLTAGDHEELLFKPEIPIGRQVNTFVHQWSSDGHWLVFSAGDWMGSHLWALSLDTRKPVTAVPADQFHEGQGSLSPDSRWIAYTSDESGVREIYIQRFTNAGRKLRVSVAGGREPEWRGDGKELFFVASDGTLMATPIRGDEALEVGTPRALFNLGLQKGTAFDQPVIVSFYDATRDGQRFLVKRLLDANSRSPLTVVVNWQSGLAARERQ